MISSLPDRPLSPTETVTISKSRAGFVLFPATPDSMFEGDQVTDVRDLLIVTETVLAVLAYEETAGWVSVVRFDDTTKFAEAIEAIVDYRDYPLSEDDIAIIVEEYENLRASEFE